MWLSFILVREIATVLGSSTDGTKADVVERYAALQDEQRLIEGELNEMKNLIIQYIARRKN